MKHIAGAINADMNTRSKDAMWGKCLTLLVFLSTACRLVLISKLNLHFEEAYYWLKAKHLDIGYYEQNPLSVWVVWLTTLWSRDTEFFVRIGFVVIFVFSTIIIYALGKEVSGSRKVGFYSALLFNAIPLYTFESAMLVVPEGGMNIFFFLLILFCFLKILRTSRTVWWYLMGVSVGFGILTLYDILIVIPIIFIFFATSRNYKRLIFNKHLYGSLFVALVIAIPLPVWDLAHQGGSCAYQFSKLLSETGIFSMRGAVNFIIGQSIALSPLFLLIFLISITAGVYLAQKKKNDTLWFLSLFSAPIIVSLLFFSFFRRGGANCDWAGIGFIPAILMTSLFFEKISNRLKQYTRFFVSIGVLSCAMSLALTVCYIVSAAHPDFYSISSRVPFFRDLCKGFYGWPELAHRISKINHDDFSILSDHEHIASEIAFYTKSIAVYCITLPYRNPSFTLWGDFPLNKNAVLITHGPASVKTLSYLKDFFVKIEEEDPLAIRAGGETIRIFHIYKCYIN